jgi:hypothetical protein
MTAAIKQVSRREENAAYYIVTLFFLFFLLTKSDIEVFFNDYVLNNKGEGSGTPRISDSGELIDLVFNKKRAEDRKQWLLKNLNPEPLTPNQSHIK